MYFLHPKCIVYLKKVTGVLQKMKANITLMEQKVGLIHINQVYDEPKK